MQIDVKHIVIIAIYGAHFLCKSFGAKRASKDKPEKVHPVTTIAEDNKAGDSKWATVTKGTNI